MSVSNIAFTISTLTIACLILALALVYSDRARLEANAIRSYRTWMERCEKVPGHTRHLCDRLYDGGRSR